MNKKSTFRTRLLILTVGFMAALPLLIAAAAVKIMPLGDSITGSPGCWRACLWSKLMDNGYTNIDFVGTLPPQGCGYTYDGENEGHGGILATNMADGNQLPPWLAASSPDIVMMFLGTNDCWSSRANDVILAAFTKLVGQMRAQNANMKIIVAQITPLNPSGCSACNSNVQTLNASLPAWRNGLTTSQSPITLVDLYTGFNTSTDTGDGCHPNDAGNQKLCDKWYTALTPLLSGSTQPPTPTRTATSTATRTPTSSVLKGDVNGDRSISIVDALMIAQYAVGLTPSPFNTAAADVNCDGSITIVDALMVAQRYVNLISTFPC